MAPDLSLSDALTRFAAVSGATHQLWAYFQYVAAGAVAVAWAPPLRGSKDFCTLLTVGLTVFAVANGRLVYKSQEDMFVVAEAIQDCVKAKGACSVEPVLLPVVQSVGAAEPWLIVLAYVGLFVAAIVGIWLPRWRTRAITQE